MSRKAWALLGVLIVVNVLVVVVAFNRGTVRRTQEEERIDREITESIRREVFLNGRARIYLVGDLVEAPYWTEVLKLAPEQRAAIKKLDALMSKARRLSWLADARPFPGSLAERQEHLERSKKRQAEAIENAQRMVTLGLLAWPQADFVTQRYLEGVGFTALKDGNIAERLGLMASQREEINQIINDFSEAYFQFSQGGAFATDRDEQKHYAATVTALSKQGLDKLKKVLTPRQLETWSRMTEKRAPPEVPAALQGEPLDRGEAVRKVGELSPTFLALTMKAKDLEMTTEQQNLVDDLIDVTARGVDWLSSERLERRGEAAERARVEFLASAESVAMLGILSEDQARRLADLLPSR